jgi:hypothetical protein
MVVIHTGKGAKFLITKFLITKFLITKFLITKFLITKLLIDKHSQHSNERQKSAFRGEG